MELAKQRWRDEEDTFRDDVSVAVIALPVSASEAGVAAATLSTADGATRRKLLRAAKESN